MVKLIPYSGKRLWIWEHQNTHPSFKYFVKVISSDQTKSVPLLPFLSDFDIGALVEQPNSDVHDFYRGIKKNFGEKMPIISLASARWYWTKQDAERFGLSGIVLWEPRNGRLHEAEIVHRGFAYYLAQEQRVSTSLPWPRREEEPINYSKLSRKVA